MNENVYLIDPTYLNKCLFASNVGIVQDKSNNVTFQVSNDFVVQNSGIKEEILDIPYIGPENNINSETVIVTYDGEHLLGAPGVQQETVSLQYAQSINNEQYVEVAQPLPNQPEFKERPKGTRWKSGGKVRSIRSVKQKFPLCCRGTVDEETKVPPIVFKQWLQNPWDTVWKPPRPVGSRDTHRSSSVLFSHSYYSATNDFLKTLFSRNCVTKKEPDTLDASQLGLMPIGYQPPFDRSKIKRITRRRPVDITPRTFSDKSMFNPSEDCAQGTPVHFMLGNEDRQCYIISGDLNFGEDEQKIIVTEDQRVESIPVKNNIEVLLAAAAEEGQEIYFCHNPDTEDGNTSGLLESQEKIIFLDQHQNIVYDLSS